jgi:uncharacterized membrane protein
MSKQVVPAGTPRVETSAASAPIPRLTPRGWWLLAFLSLGIALYALAYVALGERMYPPEFADSFRARPWGIYPHAFFGMVALGVGPFQFRRGILLGRPRLHRTLGTIYLVSALLTGMAGLYMSIYSLGGPITHFGFGILALGLLTTSTMAWARIRQGNIPRHREWVIRSFALLFAAVTLRLWLPLLTGVFGEFELAYLWVSWLCWVPNLLVAEAYVRFSRARDPLLFLTPRRA